MPEQHFLTIFLKNKVLKNLTLILLTEAATRGVLCKKVFLEISQNSQENTSARVSFFKQSCRPQFCNFIKKETLAQMFSCEFCEISKNTLDDCFCTEGEGQQKRTDWGPADHPQYPEG